MLSAARRIMTILLFALPASGSRVAAQSPWSREGWALVSYLEARLHVTRERPKVFICTPTSGPLVTTGHPRHPREFAGLADSIIVASPCRPLERPLPGDPGGLKVVLRRFRTAADTTWIEAAVIKGPEYHEESARVTHGGVVLDALTFANFNSPEWTSPADAADFNRGVKKKGPPRF
jgi:hypothetical protein